MLKFKEKYYPIFVLLFSLFLFGNTIFPTYAEEGFGGEVVFAVDYGYEGIVKSGRYLPVHVGFQNMKNEVFRGRLSFLVQEDDFKSFVYDYPVTIPANEKLDESYYIPLGNHSDGVKISLESSDLTQKLTEEIVFSAEENNSKLMIGVLSDQVQNLSYLDNVSISYGLLTSKLIDLSQYVFPDTETGLDQLDIILISDFRIRDLSNTQSRALMEWVKSGGVMILGTGGRVDDTLGRYAPELLEDMYTDPEEKEVHIGGFAKGSIAAQNEQAISIPIVRLNLHGGNILTSTENLSLISAVNKEKGLIAVAAYDFCDIASYAQSHNAYVDTMLRSVLGPSRITNIAYESSDDEKISYSEIQNVVNTGDESALPPIRGVIIILVIYLLLIGPIGYQILRRRSGLAYYRRLMLVCSLLFCIIIYLLGSPTRFEHSFYNYATILDVGPENISERTFFSMRNPYNTPYSAMLSRDYSILPISDSTAVQEPQQSTDGAGDVRISFDAGGIGVDVGRIGPFKPIFFELERSLDNVQETGFIGEVTLFKNKIHGEITNRFGYPVTRAAMLLYGKIVLLGDFLPGETKSLDGMQVYDVPISDYDYISGRITGLDEFKMGADISDPQYSTAMQRTGLLTSYMHYYMTGYTVDAKIIAFAKNPVKHTILQNDEFASSGLSLISSGITVNSIESDRLYRNVLMNNPRVLSGEYYIESNYIYAQEPAVLEYYLGEDIEPEELIFESISTDFFRNNFYEDLPKFEGFISFYNQETGNYDLVDTAQSIGKDALDSYISEDNTVTVRYSSGDSAQNNVILPMLYVVGRIK